MSDNVIRLHPASMTIHEFIGEVVDEIESFRATRALVILFNPNDQRVIMKHNVTQGDGAIVALDCIKMVNEDQEFVVDDD